MNGEPRLIDTVVLVQAYTVSDNEKHRVALALVEGVWGGEEVTRKAEKPISARKMVGKITG